MHVMADTIGKVSPLFIPLIFKYPLQLILFPVSCSTIHAGPPHVHWSAAESTIKIDSRFSTSLFILLFLMILPTLLSIFAADPLRSQLSLTVLNRSAPLLWIKPLRSSILGLFVTSSVVVSSSAS